VAAEFFQSDGQTDMTNTIVCLRNLTNGPKNGP